MLIDILTIFPQMFDQVLKASLLGKAQEKDLVKIKVHNLRQWAKDKHKSVDDRPYGGGPGMVMRVDVIDQALTDLKGENSQVILLSPQGRLLNQPLAKELSQHPHLILICGHYEGVDERVRQYLVDQEISIGNYVLTGGELPAMVLVNTVVRLLPGVVGKPESLAKESFSQTNLLDYPEYTRPEEYKGWSVPKVLLSGNHKQIDQWRNQAAKQKTKQKRPELIKTTEV